ncbi:MAG: hypothetical protein MRZ79_24860 [Bacteroidia bacterium]|nr:hypothetical protein [Bacteroidia bacterium]
MKNVLFIALALLISFSACNVLPEDQLAGMEPELVSPEDGAQGNCVYSVVYRIDEDENSCGFILDWSEGNMSFVPTSTDLFKNVKEDNITLVVEIDEASFVDDFCNGYPAFDINCVSLMYSKVTRTVKTDDIIE